ncbi:MAG: GtrA family protein [Alphaproteobacteria bacterium]|nr:GtrA family protein [Alphaproteobacteria bacterium]
MRKIIEAYRAVYRAWMRAPQKLRYLLVGGWNYVFANILLYSLLLYLLGGARAQTALFLAFLLSTLHSFMTHKTFVFGTRGRHAREYVRCVAAWSAGYLLNIPLLWALMHVANPYLAQYIASAAVIAVTYFLLKHFAFGRGHVQ